MSLVLDDNVLGMWMVELRLENEGVMAEGNWVAILSKHDTGFVINFRYRWYRDQVAYDSDDQRSFYTATLNSGITDENMAIRHARELYEFIRKQTNSDHGWELVRGARTMDEFTDALAMMPGMHMKKISKKKAKQMGLTD